MPVDYGDSWDQGQRCYFSFSPAGVVQDGIDDEGEPIYIYQTQPFFQYDLNRGGGESNTKITNAIELDKSINLICTWQTHYEGTPDKPDIKANKIEVNQVIKVTGSSAKSSASFIGLVQSINQPNKSPSKGVLVVKPIYILQNVFDETSYIKNWSIICNENKTSNYEINKDYASVEAFGLTGTTVGSAGIQIYHELPPETKYTKGTYTKNASTTTSGSRPGGTEYYWKQGGLREIADSGQVFYEYTYESISYDGESYGETNQDPTNGSFDINAGSTTTYKYYGEFSIFYAGDINYFPWDNISLNVSNELITNTITYTNEKHTDADSGINSQGYYFSYSYDSYELKSELSKSKSSFSYSYTFNKDDLEIIKKFELGNNPGSEDNTFNEDLVKFGIGLTLTDTSTTINLTLNNNSSINASYENGGNDSVSTVSKITSPVPSTFHSTYIGQHTSAKIIPNDFTK